MSTFIVNVVFILYFVVHFNECISLCVCASVYTCSGVAPFRTLFVCGTVSVRIPLICCGHFTRVFSTFSREEKSEREKKSRQIHLMPPSMLREQWSIRE